MRGMRAACIIGAGRAAAGVALAALVILAGCNFGGRPQGKAPQPPAAPAGTAQSSGGQGPGTYRAFPGDTVYGVAQRFGVPVRTLIETNALKPPFRLVAGQALRVPVRQEHVVQPGDTLLAISRIYGVDQSSVARANDLTPPYAIRPGQRLTLPGRIEANLTTAASERNLVSPGPTAPTAGSVGSMSVEELPAPASKPPAAAAADATTPAVPQQQPSKPATPSAQADSEIAAIPEPPPRAATRFLWPVRGKIVSSFGPKKGGLHNDGVNLAVPAGTSVVAADNGVVAYAGNELRGFGNLLLVRHADGWVTAYAHNSRLLVKRGQKVKRGQPIAEVGSTGNVSSPQLHFEVRRGTDPVDPLKYLGS